MNKKIVTIFLLSLLFVFACKVAGKEPSVAGIFYPSDEKELKRTVETFLSKAEQKMTEGRLVALVSPHAGYVYSGQVAAYGYQKLRDRGIKNVVLIGPSHHVEFQGASVYTKGSFKTPLGDVRINEHLAQSLLNEHKKVTFYPQAFEKEHSLEVQLPFLQTVLKDFTIVPILVGYPTRQTYEHLVSKITELLDEKTILIVSTDLSHYHGYPEAKEMDRKIISAIERLSLVDTEQLLKTKEAELCGGYPVLMTIDMARRSGAKYGVLFQYANSGDVTNEKDRVVGYASIGLIEGHYTEEEKKELLGIARKAVAEYVTNGKSPEIEMKNPKLKADGAVFVTIKKNANLKGCIGHVQPIMPLYQSVIKNAVAASSGDPRFPPMKKEELKDIDVEVSILSPLKMIEDEKNIQVGKHGLVIRKGMHSGLLLPQVATEFGWDRETFLEQICQKAGLPKGAWEDARLYTFTAEVIK